jgi:hypothetical protein
MIDLNQWQKLINATSTLLKFKGFIQEEFDQINFLGFFMIQENAVFQGFR